MTKVQWSILTDDIVAFTLYMIEIDNADFQIQLEPLMRINPKPPSSLAELQEQMNKPRIIHVSFDNEADAIAASLIWPGGEKLHY